MFCYILWCSSLLTLCPNRNDSWIYGLVAVNEYCRIWLVSFWLVDWERMKPLKLSSIWFLVLGCFPFIGSFGLYSIGHLFSYLVCSRLLMVVYCTNWNKGMSKVDTQTFRCWEKVAVYLKINYFTLKYLQKSECKIFLFWINPLPIGYFIIFITALALMHLIIGRYTLRELFEPIPDRTIRER